MLHSPPIKWRDALTSFPLFIRSHTILLSSTSFLASLWFHLSLLFSFSGFQKCKRWTFITKQYSSLSTCSCKDILGTNKGTVYLCPSLTLFHSSHLISCSHHPPFCHLFFLLPFSWHLLSPAHLFYPVEKALPPVLSPSSLCWLNVNCLFLLTQNILSISIIRGKFFRGETKTPDFIPFGAVFLNCINVQRLFHKANMAQEQKHENQMHTYKHGAYSWRKKAILWGVTSEIAICNVH